MNPEDASNAGTPPVDRPVGRLVDRPLMECDTAVRRLEVAAMLGYREMHPDGPLWQELHIDTRAMWLLHIEGKAHNASYTAPRGVTPDND